MENSKKLTADRLVEEYNSILCPPLPKVIKVTDTRIKKMKYIRSEMDETEWIAFCFKIEASDFLMGRKTDFMASFDWIIKPANFIKILEGNYDNREPVNYSKGPQSAAESVFSGFNKAITKH